MSFHAGPRPKEANMRPTGFTIIDTVVVTLMTVVVLGFGLIAVGDLNAKDQRIQCAKNLIQLGKALSLYATDNKGSYPRTQYDVQAADKPSWFTGANSKNPFANGGPKPNDVTAALFLLIRAGDIKPSAFVCPATADTADQFGDPANAATDRSNFTSSQNLSYSYANPYPNAKAVAAGYKLDQNVDATFAVAADINPGTDALLKLNPDPNGFMVPMPTGNSPNHGGDGQNVLFADGHVEYEKDPFCGEDNDNIYTYGTTGTTGMDLSHPNQQARPGGGIGIVGSPVGPEDSVLLPTASQPRPATNP
jgi:prepilin-type processing-associated H-X9-DG protein